MLYAECSGPVRDVMFGFGDEAFRRSFTDSAANFPVLDAPSLHRAWERRLSIQREWTIFLKKYPADFHAHVVEPTCPIDHDLAGREALAVISKAFSPLSSIGRLPYPRYRCPRVLPPAPPGVQIVSGQFKEERCLAAAAAMEERIGKLLPIEPKRA